MKISKTNQKRQEIKFKINSKEMLQFTRHHSLRRLFPDRVIESIYFDTVDLKFFRLSEEGITPRLKIRVRGYNDGDLNNLEIKKTNNHHREKVVFKDFKFDNFKLHESLKKIGITNVVDQKIRVKYLRSYYELNGLGRITLDRNIEFFHPNKNYHNSIRINDYVLEVKTNDNKFDKNNVEKLINFKESRFSKYCVGINCLY